MKNLKENSLIVACQALADEPLHGSEIMAKMALAAKRGGASGVRANSPEDIKAIKNKIELPIIGLWKNKLINYEVYITSKYQHAKAVLKAGADYVAIDCTDRRRPEPLSEIFNKLRTKFPDKGIVADISSTEDFKDIEKLNMISNIPILAEGNYKNGKQAKKALKAGAYAVVIGAAITRPQVITAHIIE